MDSGSKRQKEHDGEGIFRKLPEPLISCVLYFLPTKDAFRTSVLSKKWRYRWTSLTKLDLNDSVLYSGKKASAKQHFMNFVYKALLLTKSSSIESFSLVIMNKYDASLVNTWISSALNRGVKSLHVGSHLGLSFSNLTSHFLFNSHNLEELVLEVYNCSIVVPTTHFYLGHLKILKLCGIKFTLDDSSYSESLRLSFPVLKEFETVNCSWLIAKGIILDVPLLERIFIKYEQEYPSYEQEKLQFSASRLKEFTYHGYHGYIAKDIVLRDPSSAYNASANIILSNCKEPVAEIGNHAVLLLKQLCQVQYLKFEGSEVLAQSRVSSLPPFAMLSYLELGFVSCKVLLVLLQKSPLLKRLVFKGLNKFDKALMNSAIVPHCFKTSLQMLKFGNVLGREYELCLAKFCMKNCLVLERMSFSLAKLFREPKAIDDFKEKLFSFEKGSKKFAFVEFSHNC